jgi:hypothetical protein
VLRFPAPRKYFSLYGIFKKQTPLSNWKKLNR